MASTWLETCSITITYNPDIRLIRQIKALSNQVQKILIIDNHTQSEKSLKILKTVALEAKSVIIWNSINMGIGFALNQGIKYAIKHGYRWVFTLDQDSIPTKNCIEHLYKIKNLFDQKKKLGIIHANTIIHEEKKAIDRSPPIFHPINYAITSGSFFPVSLIEDVGYLDANLFIDQIDKSFSRQLGKKGYRILQANKKLLDHRLGRPEIRSFLQRRFLITHHSPIRKYYRIRNKLLLAERERFLRENLLILGQSIQEIFKVLLFEREKVQNIKMIILGVLHGLGKKAGKFII